MRLLLQRQEATDGYTLGQLFVDGWFEAFTLEDAVRLAKLKGSTAIPAGRYPVILNHSPKFKRVLPLLLHVPHFEGVRMHSGNTPDDTEGCILVGATRGAGTVGASRVAMGKLQIKIAEALERKEPVTIEIRDVQPQTWSA